MERLRRVSSLWSWLPAFRAVAETQHLPTASQQLYVSASALSRTIRLLEEDLGLRLFRRSGRRIELNEAGGRLLAAVRDAMRLVHDGIVALESKDLTGAVYVSTSGMVTTAHLLPGLWRLRAEHAELVPHVQRRNPTEVNGALLRGETDVAFVTHPIPNPSITKVHLGSSTSGVYCGEEHPLARRRKIDLEEILAHEFVTLRTDDRGRSLEHWPTTLDRRAGMVVDHLSMAVETCADGGLLAVLPDVVGTNPVNAARLRRLPLEVVPKTELFALHREALVPGGTPAAVVAAVRAAMGGS